MEECAAQEVISAKIFSDKRDWFLENASSEFRQEQGNNNYEEKNRQPAIGPKGEVSQRKEDPTNGGHRSADETNARQDSWPNQQQKRKHNWHAPRNWKRFGNNRREDDQIAAEMHPPDVTEARAEAKTEGM